MWIKWIGLICILILVGIGLASIYGGYRWLSNTEKLRAKLASGQRIIKPKIYDQKDVLYLPDVSRTIAECIAVNRRTI